MYAYVYHMPQTKAMSWEGGCLEWKKIVDHIDEEEKEHEKDQPNHFFSWRFFTVGSTNSISGVGQFFCYTGYYFSTMR